MELLKTLAEAGAGDIQADLQTSDGSDAGSTDLNRTSDVGFNLMRNTIKTDGDISASDVRDYLERAHELNDEVDTVAYGLQTSDGSIVKVYVNEKDAVEFEKAMQDMLGLEDDIEEAINELAQRFDIVDVVWPTDTPAADDEGIPSDDLGITDDMDASLLADIDGAALAKAALDKIKNAKAEEAVEETQGDTMIGASFLKRISEEADDFDGVNDGLSIELDARQKSIFMRLRRAIDRKILNLFAMSGVPGRFLDVEGIDNTIKEAGLKLRANPTSMAAFNDFYQALGKARGLSIPSDVAVEEAVDPKMKGSLMQKMLEGVLVSLGLPESLVVQGGPPQVGLALYDTAQTIEEDSGLERLLRTLFMRLKPGVKMEESTIAEEVDAGSDQFVQAVINLAVAMGIPEKNLQFQLPMLRQAVYKKKQLLTNRANVERRIEVLTDLINQGTRQPATTQPSGTV